jgi:septum formation protein
MQQLILGSSSPFRAEILSKLKIPFIQASPDIDESGLDNESPETLVKRLSLQKAHAIAINHPDALIIGSDQVAVLNEQVLGKPLTHENAQRQLHAASGQTVRFLTGLTLLNSSTKHCQTVVEPFSVVFKSLTDAQIDYYLEQEKPYQCAGSFKSEGLGISLFEKLSGDDPNALIGLPLIQLIAMLKAEGIDILQPS